MDYDKYLYWIWLNEIEGIGPITARRLLSRFGSPENIYCSHKDDLLTIKRIGDKVADNIINSKSLEKVKIILEKCYKLDINIDVYNESNLPKHISKINDCPILFYYKGRIQNNNGAVVSEYPPGERPNKKNFPKRNRLIAACCSKLLVVEASEKSGALITAEYAKKYGKEVYTVPNSTYSRESLGCNKLIMNGAKVYFNPKHLLLEQNNSRNNNKYATQSHKIENEKNSMSKNVLSLLKNTKLNVDELEIEGKVKCIRGRYIRKVITNN